MGMDSYIFKFTKDGYNKYLIIKEKSKKLEEEYTSFLKNLWEKYKCNETLTDLYKCATPEDKEKLHNFIDKYNELYPIDGEEEEVYGDDREELFYWRKPYGLHSFITQKFLNIGENDNCVYIPLSRENIETIINELKSNPSFFEGNMWHNEDTSYAIKFFSKLLDEYTDNDVITYYAWY